MSKLNVEVVNIECECPLCGIVHYIYQVPKELILRYQRRRETGEYVQDIFKDYSKVDREKIMTGYCEDCQKLIFGE